MKGLFILVLLSLASSSCHNPGCDLPQRLRMEGVHDVTLRGDTQILQISVVQMDFDESADLDITGLPAGVLKKQSPPSGKLPLQCAIELVDVSALPGNYPCQVVANGTKSGKVSYDFTLKVKSRPACGLLTVYQGSSDCGIASFTDTVSAINYIDESDVNQIRFANFGGRGVTITGTAKCSSGSISIPVQEIATDTYISGQGTFTSGGASISYSVITNGNSSSCHFTINR